MAGLIIEREDVHRLAEACSDAGDSFRPIATRLIREQRRLTRFIEHNMPALEGQSGEVGLYMYSVILRIFEQFGGRMRKVAGRPIDDAAVKLQGVWEGLQPFDEGFPDRVRSVDWRAQPHILDEALWALFERDEKEEGEVDVPADQAGLIFLLLWVAVEALDGAWTPPK